MSVTNEVESRKTELRLRRQMQAGFSSGAVYVLKANTWGCTGFDAVIGKSGLRVRALFSVINEHLKRNDKSNVVYANFGRESRLAA